MSIIGPRPLTEEIISYYDLESKKQILSTRPGLSGIGSIVFRNEQEMLSDVTNRHQFYSNEIAPYKKDLEIWYVQNKSLFLNLKLILFTVSAVLIKSSKLHWKFLKNLPIPPDAIKSKIGYPK